MRLLCLAVGGGGGVVVFILCKLTGNTNNSDNAQWCRAVASPLKALATFFSYVINEIMKTILINKSSMALSVSSFS